MSTTLKALVSLLFSVLLTFLLLTEARDGIVWRLTMLAYEIEDTWYSFLTYGSNGVYAIFLAGILYILFCLMFSMMGDSHES
ncbi:putative membrane protein [Erwinia phage pEa_SNUABM_12]|uniref:Putative membrane protein n=1 Tax=Erwinia phage pEa_SNUABM_12 TaxID=2768773 RepID=A0A7L8ZLA6_9CAUD|nr:putative membrane protein [Erwinia phage pEa_SNUABM_12]